MRRQQQSRRFHDLVLPQTQAVLRTALILTANHADAEDLAQETLLKAYQALDAFRDGTDVRAWLLTILRRTRIDRLRAAGRSSADVSLDSLALDPAAPAADHSPSPTENADELLEQFSDAQVIDALQKLPEEIRWTLLLVDVEGLGQEETAEILGVPVGTIKSRAHRGRSMLRKTLFPTALERRLVQEE